MILLAALLSFGWPTMKTEWVPANTPCPAGMFIRTINPAMGSMRLFLSGNKPIYAYCEDYHGQPVKGYIVSTATTSHQVVAESRDAVKTSGMNNPVSDPWISKKEIRSVVIYLRRDK